MSDEAAWVLQAGQPLLDYEIVERLGEGAFATVYRARHRTLERTAVIKVARGREHVDQLRCEARVLASLDHPAIPQLLETALERDPPCIVLEDRSGRTLEEVLRDGPLPAARAIELLVSVAGALSHAHSRGVVHGDVKPANILVLDGRATLIDFGLARTDATAPAELASSSSTPSFAKLAAGTPRYAAPEVLAGAPQDARSDIFSWSVVLFEALTGRLPAGGDLPSDFIAQPASQVDTVFAKCFRSAERRAAELAPLAATLTVSAPKGSEELWIRHVDAYATAVAAVLLALLPFALFAWKFHNPRWLESCGQQGRRVSATASEPSARRVFSH